MKPFILVEISHSENEYDFYHIFDSEDNSEKCSITIKTTLRIRHEGNVMERHLSNTIQVSDEWLKKLIRDKVADIEPR